MFPLLSVCECVETLHDAYNLQHAFMACFCGQFVFAILQILLPAIFVCIAMAVAKIRPSYEMPPLELTTDMFLNAEPRVHYLPFALDSQLGNSTDDLTDVVVKFPGVGKIRRGLSLS